MATASRLHVMVTVMMILIMIIAMSSAETKKVRNAYDRPGSCDALKQSRKKLKDGVYTLYLGANDTAVKAYCDVSVNKGKDVWTVFQRRKDGSVDFYRKWKDYRKGFGNANGEFWLGNDNLHALTAGKRMKLRIDMKDWDGNKQYAEYDDFQIGPADDWYRLRSLGKYSGNAGDSLRRQLGQRFSTRDRDYDDLRDGKCARRFKGAWWYQKCHNSNLNGLYLKGGKHDKFGQGVEWHYWKGCYYSLKYTEMKVAPYRK